MEKAFTVQDVIDHSKDFFDNMLEYCIMTINGILIKKSKELIVNGNIIIYFSDLKQQYFSMEAIEKAIEIYKEHWHIIENDFTISFYPKKNK